MNRGTVFFILCLFGVILSYLHAQKNRYGMSLTGTEGNYTLTEAAKICPLIPGGCNALPQDAYEAYVGYQPHLINDNDYAHCTTLKYKFKEYSSHSLYLEVDIPKLTAGPHPFVIWVHGGGWSNGGTTSFLKQSTYMASRGIAGVRITYSVISQGGHFDQGMQELADVFTFIQSHAAEWGLDLTRFGYAGGSAGTPLSSLAAMKHDGNGCKLFMGCNGIYDFQNNLAGNFGSGSSPYLADYPAKSDRDVISAINFIPENSKNIPAVAVFHGTADFTISHLQSVTLCDSVINKGGRAEQYLYDYYVHAFFNSGTSDMFEDVTIKMYEFAKSVFVTPNVTIPPAVTSGLIARFPFTTGENQSKPVDVLKGIRVSDIQVGSAINADFADNTLITSNWGGFYIAQHRYVGFEIISNPLCSFKVTKIDLKMKKSTSQALNGIFNYGKTYPPMTTKGVQKNGIATTSFSNVSLLPNNSTAAQTDENLCFGIGIATGTSTTEVVTFDEISVYGEITRPEFTVPTLIADIEKLNFSSTIGVPQNLNLTVFGELLENTVQISIADDLKGYFSVNQQTATVTELNEGKPVEVTFLADQQGEYTAELKFESDEVTMTLPLTGIVENTSAIDNVKMKKIWTENRCIYIDGYQQYGVSVYDISGQRIFQQKHLPNFYQIPLTKNGVYLVMIQKEDVELHKVII